MLPFYGMEKRIRLCHNANRSRRECAGGGVQGCSRLSIEGGSADIDDLTLQQMGTMECVVPIATLTTLTTAIRSTQTVVNAVVETLLSTRRDVTSTGTAEPTGRGVTAPTKSGLLAWNSTSPRNTSLSQVASTNPATAEPTGGVVTAPTKSGLSVWNSTSPGNTSLLKVASANPATAEASTTSTTLANHQPSGTSTMTLVVPVMLSTATTLTTSLSTLTDGSLEPPPTIIPVTSPGSCSSLVGAA